VLLRHSERGALEIWYSVKLNQSTADWYCEVRQWTGEIGGSAMCVYQCRVVQFREEENAIEEGTTRRKRQAKNYLYQFIQRVPLNVQNAFRNARQRNKVLINLSNLC
jgi:hypothetical protein